MNKGVKNYFLAAIVLLQLTILNLGIAIDKNTITAEAIVNNIEKATVAVVDKPTETVEETTTVEQPKQEEVKQETKTTIEQPKQTVKQQPKKAAEQPAKPAQPAAQPQPAPTPVVEQPAAPQMEVGSISISNSNFRKDLVKDDTSYFYLNHSLSGVYDKIGVPFIDYRNNFKGRKTIIYAHSSPTLNAPFNYLQNYHNNKGFYDAHRYIYVTYGGQSYTYEIFSVYISVAEGPYTEGLEYYNAMNYSNHDWAERIQEYKNYSEYETGVQVSGSDKILILQTCAMDPAYAGKHYRDNLLIMAKLI